MKKFISALTSLTIAATALGGTLAMSTSAATNGTVDNTVISFTSGGKDTVTVKAGADPIKVDVYLDQSQGFVSANMKMVIAKDGATVLGKDGRGDSFDAAWLAANEPDADRAQILQNMKDAGVTPSLPKGDDGLEHWMYGSYGFTISALANANANGYVEPMCLDSGYWIKPDTQGTAGSYSYFTPELFLMTYNRPDIADAGGLPDSYNAFIKSGLSDDDWYDEIEAGSRQPISSWDSSEEWVRDFAMNSFYLNVPADAVPGTYTLDLLTDTYFLPTTISWTHTSFKDLDMKENSFKSNALTIVVEGEGETTTTTSTTSSSSETTTTTSSSTSDSGTTTSSSSTSVTGGTKPTTPTGTIQFDVLPTKDQDKVTFDGAYNVITAEAGAALTVGVYASNDPGCTGQLIIMDFSEVTYVKSNARSANAYGAAVSPQVNDDCANTDDPDFAGQQYVAVVWVNSDTVTADPTSPVMAFNITVPAEDGTYTIGETTFKVNTTDADGNDVVATRKTNVTGAEEGTTVDYVFYGLKIVVGEAETTTTTSTTSSSSETTTTTSSTSSETTTSSTSSSETTTTTSSTSSIVGDKVWGDANEDGKVTISDVILLNKAMANNATLSDQGQINADTTGDGTLTSDDALLIKGFLAKLCEKGSTDADALKAYVAK